MIGGVTVQQLTWLDVVWLVIIGILLLRGFFRGFFQEVLELVGLAAAFYIALQVYEPLSEALLQAIPGVPLQAARAGAFGVVAAGVLVLAAVLSGMVAHLIHMSPLSWVDSLAGALFGAAKGLGVVALLVTLIGALPEGDLRRTLHQSAISRRIAAAVPQLWDEVRQALPEGLPPLPGAQGSRGGPTRGPSRGSDGVI